MAYISVVDLGSFPPSSHDDRFFIIIFVVVVVVLGLGGGGGLGRFTFTLAIGCVISI
jgi:hypothetical protein